MSDVAMMQRDDAIEVAKAWWLPVVVGVFLILYSFVVLSFSIRTVYAVAIGLGVGLLVSGIGQLLLLSVATSWRWLILLSAIVDIGLAIAAFAWPHSTFLVMARLVGWVLLLRGIVDITKSFEARRLGDSGWWILIFIGSLNIGIAFWASRYPGRSITLLVLWVGIALMTRGIVAIASGFALRSMGKELKAA